MILFYRYVQLHFLLQRIYIFIGILYETLLYQFFIKPNLYSKKV